jgi:hypothetical protein
MRSRHIAIVALCFLALSSGCGRRGHGAETDPEKGYDAATLNSTLSKELTIFGLYVQGLPRLRGPAMALGRRLRAQEQEYIDALTKAIRGLGGDVEAEAEPLSRRATRSQVLVLRNAIELEEGAVGTYMEASPRLNTDAPRTLATALAAGHAQHLVVLRQALGAPFPAALTADGPFSHGMGGKTADRPSGGG